MEAALVEERGEGQTPTPVSARGGVAACAVAAVIFAGLSIWGAVVSDGFLEADACTHYLYARFAVGEPHYLVNVWGRPVATGVYAIPAALWGRMGVRMTSLVCALAIAWIAYRIAKRQAYRRPELAFIFVLGQPLVFLHSFSELTELPFALLLALTFWAYCARRWGWMALAAGMLPLARPEGFLFVALAGVALVMERKWWWVLVLPAPLALWSYVGWRLYGRPWYSDSLPGAMQWVWWLKAQWPYAQESAYQAGSLWHFVWFLPAIVGPLVVPGVVIGIVRNLWKRRSATQVSPVQEDERHRRQCQVLMAVIPLMILGAHSLLYWRGKMASNGELRYMLTVAAFWGLLAAWGWEGVFEKLRWSRGAAAAIAIVMAVAPVFVNLYWQVVPLHLSQEWHEVARMAQWYRSDARAREYPKLLVSHPAFYYFMDVSPSDGSRMEQWSREAVKKMRPGTLLVWHHVYAMTNSDRERIVPLEEIYAAGWVEDTEAEGIMGGYGWRVFKSARAIAAGK